MTTIVYRDGIMAADSQLSMGGVRRGVSLKIQRLADGSLIAGCGGSGHIRRLIEWVAAGAKLEDKPTPPDEAGAASLMQVSPDKTVTVWNTDGDPQKVMAPFMVMGSGNEIALGALEMGASAMRAVEVAIIWDTGSGGPVQVESLAP